MQHGMSRFTAVGALVLALGAGAIGGAMTSGGGSDPAVPPTVGMKVADQTAEAPVPETGLEPTTAPTPVPVLMPEAGPVAAPPAGTAGQDEPSAVSPDTDAAEAAADRAKREADRAEKAADRAEEVVKTPVPTPVPVPVVTPKPTPERECAPEGHVARETQSQGGKVLRTRSVTCTGGKQVYGPWEYPAPPTPTPAVPPPSE